MSERLRALVGRRLVSHCHRLEHRLLIVAVAARHGHLLIELPAPKAELGRGVGRLKQGVAVVVQREISQRLWAKSFGIRRISDRAHQRRVFDYIERHREAGAWVWTFRNTVPGDEEDSARDA